MKNHDLATEVSSNGIQSYERPFLPPIETPRKKKLRNILKQKNQKLRRLSSKLITKTSPSKGLKKAQKIKKALKLLEGVVSPDLLNFLKTQLKLSCYHSCNFWYIIGY